MFPINVGTKKGHRDKVEDCDLDNHGACIFTSKGWLCRSNKWGTFLVNCPLLVIHFGLCGSYQARGQSAVGHRIVVLNCFVQHGCAKWAFLLITLLRWSSHYQNNFLETFVVLFTEVIIIQWDSLSLKFFFRHDQSNLCGENKLSSVTAAQSSADPLVAFSEEKRLEKSALIAKTFLFSFPLLSHKMHLKL